jgi:HSP20 family protein
MSFRNPSRTMWARALKLLEQSDRLHRQFFHLGGSNERGPFWEPPVDVFDTDRELTILVALPGVNPSEVEVLIDDGVVYVIGERRFSVSANSVIRRLEIPYGRFERRIGLPPGHFEVGERMLVNGNLRLSLRKLV